MLEEFEMQQRAVMLNTEGYNVSERYKVINTYDVVQRFEQYGFELTSIDAGRVRDIAKVGKGKHMVRMAADFKMAGGLRPEVIIHNSYDGTRALNIRVGLFRFVCSNGIVAGHNLVPNLQVLHSNAMWEDLINEFIDTYEEKHRVQQDWVESMMDRKMTLDEAYIMAEKALQIRHYDKRIINDPVDPLELLIAQRKEDRDNNAWTKFNVLQENLVQGNFRKYDNDGTIRKAKVMTNIDELIRFNVELSDMFENVL